MDTMTKPTETTRDKQRNAETPPTDIYDAEAIAEQINRFLDSLPAYIRPALAEGLTLRYAEALLSWHRKLN